MAHNVHFVMDWRAGCGAPLASATAKAVLSPAPTTATALGSLACSHHPGTAGMDGSPLPGLGRSSATTLALLPAPPATPPRPAGVRSAFP